VSDSLPVVETAPEVSLGADEPVLVVVTSPALPSGPRPGPSWASVLDALEADVEALEEALAHDHVDTLPPAGTWPPPEGLGPMPREHLARARALQARQLRALDQLALALGDLRGTMSYVAAASDRIPTRAFLDESL
jgi:hypothetical protein